MMKDSGKTKSQLLRGMAALRKRVAKLEAAVTERQRAKAALRESEARFRSLVETTSDWVWEVDQDVKYTYASPKVRDLLGYQPKEVIGKTPFDFMPPDEADRVFSVFREIAESREPFAGLENTNLHKNGQPVVLETSGIPIFGASGNFLGYRGIDRDITERKRSEAALRESEERYRALYEDNPSMYFTMDSEGTVLSVNQFGAEQLGYTVEELVGQSVLKVFIQDDKPAVVQQLALCVQDLGRSFHWEFRKVRKDGSVVNVKEVARAVQGTDGKPVVLVVCEDITERKQAEAALRRAHDELEQRVQERTEALHDSREHFRKLVETVNVIPWEADLVTWRFTYVGPQAVGILGYPVEKWFEGDFWINHIHAEDREFAINFCMEASQHKRDFEFEYRMVDPHGRAVWLRDLVTVVPGDGGASKLRGFMIDITERKRLEKEIIEVSAREQRRIGQDLHDGLGQHLAGIAFLSKVLEQKLAAKASAEASEAAKIGTLVNQAVSQSRDLARGLCPVQLEANGLVAALEELVSKTESLFKVSCRFQFDHPILIHDNAVATHLYYIGQEAVSNAIKHAKPQHIVVGLAGDNDRINLMVKDDGIGIPDVIEKHTGMGLHIMNYRARMIDGSLNIQRNPGGGTMVTCSVQNPTPLM